MSKTTTQSCLNYLKVTCSSEIRKEVFRHFADPKQCDPESYSELQDLITQTLLIDRVRQRYKTAN